MIPVISTKPVDPAIAEKAFAVLRNSHRWEHQAIAALKQNDVCGAKIALQQQAQAIITVLAML